VRLRIVAKRGELGRKAVPLVRELSKRVRDEAPDLAEMLEKAIPRKVPTIRYPALRELNEQVEAEYQRLMALMIDDIEAVLENRGRASTTEPAEKSQTEAEWVGEALEKGATHKYFRRWRGKSGKWEYEYDLLSAKVFRDYEPGDKVRVTHNGKVGHFEVLSTGAGEGPDRLLTVRHDETGHETQVSQGWLAHLFARTHEAERSKVEVRAMEARFQHVPPEAQAKLNEAADRMRAVFGPRDGLMPAHVRWGVLEEALGWATKGLTQSLERMKRGEWRERARKTMPETEPAADEIREQINDAMHWLTVLRDHAHHETWQALIDPKHPGHDGARDVKSNLDAFDTMFREFREGSYRGLDHDWRGRLTENDNPRSRAQIAARVLGHVRRMTDLMDFALHDMAWVQQRSTEYELDRVDATEDATSVGGVKVLIHRTALTRGRPVADSLAQIRAETEAVQRAGFGRAVKDLTIHLRGGTPQANNLEASSTTAGAYYPERRGAEGYERRGDVMLHTLAFADGRGPILTGVLTHELGHRFYYRDLSPRARAEWEGAIAERSVILRRSEVDALKRVLTAGNEKYGSVDMRGVLRALESDPEVGRMRGAGHVLEYLRSFQVRDPDGLVNHKWLNDVFETMVDHPMVSPFVTWYGGNNASEYFAEAFQKYVQDGPRSLPDWTREFFDRVTHEGGLRKAFGDGPEEKEPGEEADDQEKVEPGEYNPKTDEMEPEPEEPDEEPGEPEEMEESLVGWAPLEGDSAEDLWALAKSAQVTKYIRRWRGKDGKYQYEYPDDHPKAQEARAAAAAAEPEKPVVIRDLTTDEKARLVDELSGRSPRYLEELGARVAAEIKATATSRRGSPSYLFTWAKLVNEAIQSQQVEEIAEEMAAEPVPVAKTAVKQPPPQQLGFMFGDVAAKPKPKAEEPKAGELEPVVPEVEEPGSAPAEDAEASGGGGKGSRRKHVEVGEHVGGSRADLAMPRTEGELAALTPSDQKRFVTKAKMLPEWEAGELLEQGWEPGAILMRYGLERCIASAPADSLEARQHYMRGIDYLARSYEQIRTVQDFEDFAEEWHHNVTGMTLVHKGLTQEELFRKRDERLTAAGKPPPMTYDEYRKTEDETEEVLRQIRVRRTELVASGTKTLTDIDADPEMKRLQAKRRDLDALTTPYEGAAGHHDGLRGFSYGLTDLDGRDSNVSIHKDGTVWIYAGPHYRERVAGIRENPYAGGLAALGEKMVKAIGKPYGMRNGPKALADAYLKAHQWERAEYGTQVEELHKLIGQKVRTSIVTRPFRWERVAEREGREPRVGGRPVAGANAEAMAKEFGFRNVQFGNWISDQDAETHLQAAHGALYDLADLLGISDATVGLQGRLALAFGGRGSGKASAHYEGGAEIINLTKFAGGGSLAHEWSHALDNIVSKMANPGSTSAGLWVSEGSHGALPEAVASAWQGVMGRIMWADAETAGKASRMLDLSARSRDLTREEHRELAKLKRESTDWKRSRFYERSAGMTKTENSYWTRPRELFARAFESWVETRLEKDGRANTYLVSGTSEEAGRHTAKVYNAWQEMAGRPPSTDPFAGHPYPTDKDRDEIGQLFETLIAAIRDHQTIEKALAFLDERDALRKAARVVKRVSKSGMARLIFEGTDIPAEEELFEPTWDDLFLHKSTGSGTLLGERATNMTDLDLDLSKGSWEGAERPGHKYIRREGTPGNYRYWYPGDEEREDKPATAKRRHEDPDYQPPLMRYSDEASLEKLIAIGNELQALQDDHTKDDTGFSNIDVRNWGLVAARARADDPEGMHRLRAMLAKYKRQIAESVGLDQYYKLGLHDAMVQAQGGPTVQGRWRASDGALLLGLVGRVGKGRDDPKWAAYVAINRSLGVRAAKDREGNWYNYVPAQDVDKFDVDTYRGRLADEVGVTLGEIPERPVQAPKADAAPTGSEVTVQTPDVPSPVETDDVIDAIVDKRARDTIAVKVLTQGENKGKLAIWSTFSPDFNAIMGNKSSDPRAITGIVEVRKELGWARLTNDPLIAEEALTKLRQHLPQFTFVIDPNVDEWKAAHEAKTREAEKPVPEVQAKINPEIKLFPFQNAAVRFFEANGGNGLLGDEMGLGKTLESLAYAAATGKRVIVACPKVVRKNWLLEAKRFFPGHFDDVKELVSKDLKSGGMPDLSKTKIATINYEILDKFMPAILAGGFDLLIVDESHRIKNPKALLTKRIQEISKSVKHRILLSGTALKNKREELYTQLQLVRPGFVSLTELKSGMIGALHHKLDEIYLARKKKDVVAHMPPKLRQAIQLDVPHLPEVSPARKIKEESGWADELTAEERRDLGGGGDLAEVTRIKHQTAIAKAPVTAEFVNELLESSDSQILVFTDSVPAANILKEKLGDVAVLHTGKQSTEAQDQARAHFDPLRRKEGDPVRVLVSTTAKGIGFNGQVADKVVFNDLPWTPADKDQAEDRAYRIGTKNTVNVYDVHATGSAFDSATADLLLTKAVLYHKLMDGQKLSPAETAWATTKISAADILARMRGEAVGPKLPDPAVKTSTGVTVLPPTDSAKAPAPPKPEPKPEPPPAPKAPEFTAEQREKLRIQNLTAAAQMDDVPEILRNRIRYLNDHEPPGGGEDVLMPADGKPWLAWMASQVGKDPRVTHHGEHSYTMRTRAGVIELRYELPPSGSTKRGRYILGYTSQGALPPLAPEPEKPETPATQSLARKPEQLALFKALVGEEGAAAMEDAEFIDWTKPIVDAAAWAYERVQEALAPYGYGPGDYVEGGRLHGLSTNDLIDRLRELRRGADVG
jgi:superfamily II DNA or RNA helicase